MFNSTPVAVELKVFFDGLILFSPKFLLQNYCVQMLSKDANHTAVP